MNFRLTFWSILLCIPMMLSAQTLSNADVLKHQMIPVLVDTIKTIVPAKSKVVLSVEPRGTFADWMRQQFTQELLRKKIRVYKTASSDVNYRILVSGVTVLITYQPVSRNWLGRVKHWKRIVQLIGQLEVISSLGEVKMLYPLQLAYTDTVTAKLKTLEQADLPFTHGTVEDTTHWQRWVEPILISVATITVVTLFFTIRSQQR